MSHLIKNNTSLQDLKKVTDKLKCSGNIDYTTIIKTLEILIPRDSNGNCLIDYNRSNDAICGFEFDYGYNTIFISNEKFNENVYEIMSKIDSKICEYDKLNNIVYLYLYLIGYELEIGVQSLIANNKFSVSSPLISQAYHEIYDFLNDNCSNNLFKLIRKIVLLNRYWKNEEYYLLERNAVIESLDLIEKFALFENDQFMYDIFHEVKNNKSIIGYDSRFSCPLEETYNAIGMGSKYKKMNLGNNLSDDDKIRYGLPISSELRKLVLTKRI